MARDRRDDDAVIEGAAAIVGRLGDRLSAVVASVQQLVVTEIAEMRDDTQLLQLLHDSVEGNIETVFSAIRHGIPIEDVEPPTAALEHARRLAQRGVSVNALVRAYRLGHKAVLDVARDEIRAANVEAQLSLDIFDRSRRSRSATSTGSPRRSSTLTNASMTGGRESKQHACVAGSRDSRQPRHRHRRDDDRDSLSAQRHPLGRADVAR